MIMAQSKKVYTLHGSEDGIIGVFSSRKRAEKRGIEYVEKCDEIGGPAELDKDKHLTFITTPEGRIDATVEVYYLE